MCTICTLKSRSEQTRYILNHKKTPTKKEKTEIKTSHKSTSFNLKYSNFNNAYWKAISSRCFFGYFFRQCITDLEEKGTQISKVYVLHYRWLQQHVSCTLNERSHRNTSPKPQEGWTRFRCSYWSWWDFISRHGISFHGYLIISMLFCWRI